MNSEANVEFVLPIKFVRIYITEIARSEKNEGNNSNFPDLLISERASEPRTRQNRFAPVR